MAGSGCSATHIGVGLMSSKPLRKRGIYRVNLPSLGECARVTPAAGDAYPFLHRDLYDALGFWPAFEELRPISDSERQRHGKVWHL